MSRDRFDALSPRDVVATLRSLERRFGAVAKRAGQERISEIIDGPGPSGARLSDLIADAARGAAAIAQALDTSLDTTEPVIAAAILDPTERVFTDDRAWSVDAGVDALVSDAQRAAERIDRATADALSRRVAVTGSGATTPLAVGQQLARELIGALTTAERHLDWLEGQV